MKIRNRAKKNLKPRVTLSVERLDERIMLDVNTAGPRGIAALASGGSASSREVADAVLAALPL